MASASATDVQEVELSAGTVRYRDSGSGPTLVFVHGLIADGTLWRKVVPLLEDRFRCVVPDWPLGSHRIPMEPGADLSPQGVARTVLELLEALDLREAILVANDTGGAITQLAAAELPERVGGLVLTPSDAFDNFLPPLFRPLQLLAKVPGGLTAALQPLRLRAARRLPFAYGGLAKRPIPASVTDAWLAPFFSTAGVRRDTARFLAAVDSRETVAAAERLREFRRPALVVWASETRVFPLDHGRRLAALLPDATLEVLDDTYTYIPEDRPERLAELIGGFASG